MKAEFTGANMVMFRSGLFSADACPRPCIQTIDRQWEHIAIRGVWPDEQKRVKAQERLQAEFQSVSANNVEVNSAFVAAELIGTCSPVFASHA